MRIITITSPTPSLYVNALAIKTFPFIKSSKVLPGAAGPPSARRPPRLGL